MQESKIKALDESNRAAARPGGKEAGVKTASPRTETCFEAGGGDERAQHREVLDSLPQVKHGVVPGKLTRLLGRPARQALRLGRSALPPATAAVNGQESAEVVVVRETSRE